LKIFFFFKNVVVTRFFFLLLFFSLGFGLNDVFTRRTLTTKNKVNFFSRLSEEEEEVKEKKN